MDTNYGGNNPYQRSRMAMAAAARRRVQAVYDSAMRSVKRPPKDNRYITPPRPEMNYSTAPSPIVSEPEVEDYYPDFNDHSENTENLDTNVAAYDTPKTNSQLELPANTTTSSVEDTDAPKETTPIYESTDETSALKDAPIDQSAINHEWAKYHSAWQTYYQNYYSEYYAKAAQSYLDTEKLKNERAAGGELRRKRRLRTLIPIGVLVLAILTTLFLQYNRVVIAPIMAYISPDVNAVSSSIEAVDPSITQSVSADPRLIIPKLNIDVPVAFGIHYNDVMSAMNHGVAQFSIPGANAMPGQVGNLVISGHSAGDIYSSNPYKFIFSGLERLEDGDLIYINYESVRYTYRMIKREVVEPTNVQALIYATDKPLLTLITCTPLGTSRYRLLITAEQISPDYTAPDLNNPEEVTNPSDEETDANYSMPANEPSFFDRIFGRG